jgi:polyhydroxyalkanoate synthesis regulator phasin
MEDLFKKFVYTGVGVANTAVENIQKSLNNMADKGKNSEEEGRKLVEEAIKDTKTKRNELEARFKNVVDKALGSLDFPTRGEVERLNAKISELEDKLFATNLEKDNQSAAPENERLEVLEEAIFTSGKLS